MVVLSGYLSLPVSKRPRQSVSKASNKFGDIQLLVAWLYESFR